MVDALGRQSPLPPGNTKRIRFKSSPEAHQVAVLSGELGIHSALSSLLVQRGITNFHDAKAYFRPSLEDLHDPFLMKHMCKAVDRLVHAFTHQESILVYGDYDVDGVTSVAMFYQFLKFSFELFSSCNYDPNFLIHARFLMQCILLTSRNPVELFPIHLQTFAMYASATASFDLDISNSLSCFLLNNGDGCIEMFVCLLFPHAFVNFFRRSAIKKYKFHIAISDLSLTLNEALALDVSNYVALAESDDEDD